jgi:SAM-dependent methyltransferase
MHTLPPDYFNDVYRANADPWQFATSPYERDKYAATLAALPRERYENAFEIGCSIGVLSAQLAPRCGGLLCVDASELPLEAARERLAAFPHVRVARMVIPEEFPDETFDLILLSEVGYYLAWDDLRRTRDGLTAHLRPGGHLLLVHWTPPVPDYPLTGDEVHEFFHEISGADQPFVHRLGQRADQYRLDLFEKR